MTADPEPSMPPLIPSGGRVGLSPFTSRRFSGASSRVSCLLRRLWGAIQGGAGGRRGHDHHPQSGPEGPGAVGGDRRAGDLQVQAGSWSALQAEEVSAESGCPKGSRAGKPHPANASTINGRLGR